MAFERNVLKSKYPVLTVFFEKRELGMVVWKSITRKVF